MRNIPVILFVTAKQCLHTYLFKRKRKKFLAWLKSYPDEQIFFQMQACNKIEKETKTSKSTEKDPIISPTLV